MKNTPNWKTLLSATRRKSKGPRDGSEVRTEIERDHDRILFSAPVRRLADKTQVFPLERNDSVRNRLTHSHEVSNLARSVGITLAFVHGVGGKHQSATRDIPALLAAVGLAHDLGNPPFGHQGEAAIRAWFERNRRVFQKGPRKLNSEQLLDFLKFEGNAQGLRLLTRLQLLSDDYGLDLTCSVLAALMKYTVTAGEISDQRACTKKHGYFLSEQHIAMEVLDAVGLEPGQRHALAYVMEACDDIAYVVLDVEDLVKKQLASFSDLIAYLAHHGKDDPVSEAVRKNSLEKHEEYRKRFPNLSPAELNDVSMQRFRVYAIGELIRAATAAFVKHEKVLVSGHEHKTLMALSTGEKLRKTLKNFAITHAYKHNAVLEVELRGYNAIQRLMDFLWVGIIDREDFGELNSPRKHPFSRYVYSRISENYRRIFEASLSEENKLPIAYREAQLMTDMIAGMTDSYAVDLLSELERLRGDFDTRYFLSKPSP